MFSSRLVTLKRFSSHSSRKKTTVRTVQTLFQSKEPIAVMTAYDYSTARFCENAGVDVVLVGDSLGMVCLGYETTVQVTLSVFDCCVVGLNYCRIWFIIVKRSPEPVKPLSELAICRLEAMPRFRVPLKVPFNWFSSEKWRYEVFWEHRVHTFVGTILTYCISGGQAGRWKWSILNCKGACKNWHTCDGPCGPYTTALQCPWRISSSREVDLASKTSLVRQLTIIYRFISIFQYFHI